MGDGLSLSDIDQIFIATNFEVEDQEDNDDKNLVRYEFLEILVRIARKKFVDTKVCSSYSEATRKIISEYVLPNNPETLSWQ